MKVAEIVDARKNEIKADDAWRIFQSIRTLHIGRGKKTATYTPNADSKEEILKVTLGRTGNLRAPALRTGTVMYVGYNDVMYKELIG